MLNTSKLLTNTGSLSQQCYTVTLSNFHLNCLFEKFPSLEVNLTPTSIQFDPKTQNSLINDCIEQVFNTQSLPTYNFSPIVAQLYQVEARLGISRQTILNILSSSGYHIEDKPNAYLTHNHILEIAKAYNKSLRQLFKKAKKEVNAFGNEELNNHADFFRNFIYEEAYLDDNEVFAVHLDSSLITKWIVDVLSARIDLDKFGSSFLRIWGNLKFRIRKLNLDKRVQFASILITHHYHVFPSEDDKIVNL